MKPESTLPGAAPGLIAGNRAKVLIADDHPAERDYLRSVLGYAGHEVIEAADGQAALDEARAQRPDLIITDILMPRLDGLELIRRLRGEPAIAATRVIVWSATFRQAEASALAAALCVARFVKKPVEPADLLATVADVLDAPPPRPVPEPVLARLEGAHQRLMGDKLFKKTEELEAEVRARRRTEAALRESRQRYAGLIGSAMDAIICIDAEQRIVLFNRAAEAMFRCTAGDVLGGPVAQLIPARHRAAHHGHVTGFGHTGSTARSMGRLGAIWGLRADGEEFPIEASISKTQVDGRWQYTVIMRDITERTRAEAALRAADRHKDEFLAMLAHELRNPLAPILNAAHVLERLDSPDPRVQWAQALVRQQVVHLARLVDDLLDVSRIAEGKIALARASVCLAELMRQAAEAAAPLMAARGHRFEVTPPEEPIALEGDPVRLAQVLHNLLNNAAKYTPEGGSIELAARRVGGEVEIRVSDDGVGMSADFLPRAFELFRQGDRSLDRAQGGLGIGLTLVRRLVELHGGTVAAASPGPGLGTTLTVRLPALAPEVPAAPETPAAPAASAAGIKVLVVDDDAMVADSTARLLALEGCDTRVVASGAAALELLAGFGARLVLLDIGLPGQNGYEVARRIRALPGGEAIGLVAVSGYGHPQARADAQAAGFDHYLVKPANPVDLIAILRRLRG